MHTSATVPFTNDLWNTYSVYVAGCPSNVMLMWPTWIGTLEETMQDDRIQLKGRTGALAYVAQSECFICP